MTQESRMIGEMTEALASTDHRGKIVLRMADLFAFGAEGFNQAQIQTFDDVFTALVLNIEKAARVALAQRLATIKNAPPGISRKLADDQDIDVAGPMLELSRQLDSSWLAQAARKHGQDHLLRISRRPELDTVVTDALIERGSRPVVLSTVRNAGAKISNAGFTRLVLRSGVDEEFAIAVGLRVDIPRHQLLRLLAHASETVRAKLTEANPAIAALVDLAVSEAAQQFQASTASVSRNFQAAQALVHDLNASGRLTEAEVESFARRHRFEETAAALAALCRLPVEAVERALVQDRPEALMMMTKSLGFDWQTVKTILQIKGAVPALQLEQCLETFSRLKPATARQVVDFQRKRLVTTP